MATVVTPNLTTGVQAANWRERLGLWWVAKAWPWKQRWGAFLCAINRHQLQPAPALDAKGDFDLTKPGRYLRCARLRCQVFAGRHLLVRTDKWAEIDTMMVIARLDCPQCFGRGYRGKLKLTDDAKAQLPCNCLRIQPAYVERVEKKTA